MKNFTLVKNNFSLLFFLLFSINPVFGQCPSGQTQTGSTTHVYATSVSRFNNVSNSTNALGSDIGTVARFNNNNDYLELNMGSIISAGSSVTVNDVADSINLDHDIDGWVIENRHFGNILVGTNINKGDFNRVTRTEGFLEGCIYHDSKKDSICVKLLL